MDPPVLSYGDIFLRKSDVDLLKGPCWLNDQVIAFYLLYLTRDKYPGTSGVELLEPSVTFWLACCPDDEVAPIVAARKLAQKSLVILPINDNDDPRVAQGGSHWSTLVFLRELGEFQLFDSMGTDQGHPTPVAATLARKLAPHLTSSKRPRLSLARCPQQQNGFDCGLYVLAVAEVLVRADTETSAHADKPHGPQQEPPPHAAEGERHLKASKPSASHAALFSNDLVAQMMREVTPASVTALRSTILATIHKLAGGNHP